MRRPCRLQLSVAAAAAKEEYSQGSADYRLLEAAHATWSHNSDAPPGFTFPTENDFPDVPGNSKLSVFCFFRIFRSENDLKFKFRFSTFSDRISVFSDRISVFSDRKMLLVIGNCKISEEK